ncbi:MAG: MBL fold metallo-hydrolase [Melioribacteraceae bacterium]|nr:MBL fold metallo-hydrolase [Melioribacteraceae bacterium]MCF8265209.1 MBL fold metallo-hydrolase [Melioribacteraceae bacterium]MCF8431773.1 MBL fold metallo-hydrolase [Melioribacteraceae bacterium]
MKKNTIVFPILLFALLLSPLVYSQNRNFPQKIEAEAAGLDSVLVLNQAEASGNYFVRIENKGEINWEFYLEKAGWFEISFRYRAFGGEKEEFLIKNGVKIPIGFAMAESWRLFKKKVSLKKGLNKISILPSWGNIDLDYLSISETIVEPSANPEKNYFYKNSPQSLSIKIDLYGHRIESIKSDGNLLNYSITKYPFNEDSYKLKFSTEQLSLLPLGENNIKIAFKNGTVLNFKLMVESYPLKHDFIILAPYVEHGTAVLFSLPNGEYMLVDCGKSWVRDEILIPFLQKYQIEKIDHFFISHYHDDHDGGDDGLKIKEMFNVSNFYDYKSFDAGDKFEIGNVNFTILNSFVEGRDENSNSLSFKMDYKGFEYIHGGDTYAHNQVDILHQFPQEIGCDVFYANHHFHGSVSSEYLRTIKPEAVIIQAQEAIYARSAYMVNYLTETVQFLSKTAKFQIHNLPNLEVGTVVIRANGSENWWFETYQNSSDLIPGIPAGGIK